MRLEVIIGIKKEGMTNKLSTSKSPSRHKIDLNLIDDASKLLRIVMESYGWRYIKLEVIAGIKKGRHDK